MKFDEIEINKNYYFGRDRFDSNIAFIGKVIKHSLEIIIIDPLFYINGFGDLDDLREFNKNAFNGFFSEIYEVGTSDKKEDYPEYFL